MSADKGSEGPPERSTAARVGDDVCRVTFVGDISGAEMKRVLDLQKELMGSHEGVLLLIDMRRIGHVAAEARKMGAEANVVKSIAAAIFGASLHVRMLAKLVTTAGAIFRKAKPTDIPVEFFETEEQAVAWLDERRAARRKAGS